MPDKIPEDLNASLTQLACAFFFWFSRFEFAMKANDFLKDSTAGAKAEAGWKKLNTSLAKTYAPTASATELLAAKVQQPVVDPGGKDGMKWIDLKFEGADPTIKRLTITLRAIRNNLFHGGKSGIHGWLEPARTSRLLYLGICVLDELAETAGFQEDYTGKF